MSLAGKVALVTGSTQGIGLGMLRALAGAGAGEREGLNGVVKEAPPSASMRALAARVCVLCLDGAALTPGWCGGRRRMPWACRNGDTKGRPRLKPAPGKKKKLTLTRATSLFCF